MSLLIKNGRVIDPANHRDDILDVLVESTKISQIAKNLKTSAEEVIDAKGRIVIPGLVDMHVHLREPGREDKETVATGTLSALKGGITGVLAMPNTHPAMDSPENIELLKTIIKNSASTDVFICGAITKNRRGVELTDFSALKKRGVLAVSDDGTSLDSDRLMLDAFNLAKQNNLLVICHSEDKALSAGGVVNLGFTSTRMGLRGISRESEYKRVERDIKLAEHAGARLHIAHVSCKESVEIIAQAKKEGIRVTSDTAPHYFSLTEEEVLNYDTNKKMNPPLRGKDDVAAIKQALADGTIDVIASDHAPHTDNEKDIEFDRAEFGVIGLETELAVTVTELVNTGILSWVELARKMSFNPAKILGIDKGALSEGVEADMVIIEPEKEWIAGKEGFISKSKNSAFLGKRLTGVVEYTICGGKIAYRAKE